jgi:hypothetical protein
MEYEDERFKSDLEKAIALSLETLEIEKCKQKLLSSGRSSQSSQEALKEYQEYLAKKRHLIENKPQELPPRNSREPPPLAPRITLPTSSDELDLINFNATTTAPNLGPKPPDPHKEFIDYVTKLQVRQLHRYILQNETTRLLTFFSL